jgi:hypothetical protein
LALAEPENMRITGGVIRGPERVRVRWDAARS